jgi:hypothetical protein
MLDKTRILLMAGCLLIGILLGVGIKTIYEMMERNAETGPYEKLPRRLVVVSIEKDQQEQLFDQLSRFSDEQGFAIRIAPTTPSGQDFVVEMWREDIKVIALNSFDPGIFNVGFFDTDGTYPYPLSEWDLDALVSNFGSYVHQIPDAEISEK